MATRNPNKHSMTLTWLELSEVLSKAKVLSPDENIANLTLAHPRTLLIHTAKLKPK